MQTEGASSTFQNGKALNKNKRRQSFDASDLRKNEEEAPPKLQKRLLLQAI